MLSARLLAGCLAMTLTAADPGPVVDLVQGRIQGYANGSYAYFRGVPFAEPPTGPERRWRPPKPLPEAAWNTTRDATDWAPDCSQLGPGWPSLGNVKTSSEDCLYLNVYAPQNALGDASRRLPVMVFIPAGSFLWGAARDWENSNPPARAVARANALANGKPKGEPDVIYATINYRLGVFGFAAHDALRSRSPDGGTGHYGMDDQREALRFLRQNAAAFGGDPNNIVIWGESAGASSVTLHMLSEKSWPLFDKAIIQSGAFNAWVDRDFRLASENFEALARAVGCLDPPLGKREPTPAPVLGPRSVACLERKTERALLATSDPFYGNLTGYSPEPPYRPNGLRLPHQGGIDSSTWSPPIDGVNLADRTSRLLRQGRVAPRKPLLFGNNLNDGTQFLMDGSGGPSPWNTTVWRRIAEYYFGRAAGSDPDFRRLYVDSVVPEPDCARATIVSEDSTAQRACVLDGDRTACAWCRIGDGRSEACVPNRGVAFPGCPHRDRIVEVGPPFRRLPPTAARRNSKFAARRNSKFAASTDPAAAKFEFPRDPSTPSVAQRRTNGSGSGSDAASYQYSNSWYAASYALTDYLMTCAGRRAARTLSGYDHLVAPFVYYFKTTPARSPNFPSTSWLGAFHGAEVPFTWGDDWKGDVDTAEEVALSDAMIAYWTNFAWTGDPNRRGPRAGEGSPAARADPPGPAWARYSNATDSHLELQKQSLSQAVGIVGEYGRVGGGLTEGRGLRREQCDFWDRFVEQLPIPR
jgi:carboxylesterase type B